MLSESLVDNFFFIFGCVLLFFFTETIQLDHEGNRNKYCLAFHEEKTLMQLIMVQKKKRKEMKSYIYI